MKTGIGIALIVVDVIAVKAEILAHHAAHSGSKVLIVGSVLVLLNLIVFRLLTRGSQFGGPR